jgi:acetyl esterase/lipase
MQGADYWQRLGLFVINALARPIPAAPEQVAYGDLPRHYLDWYRHPTDAARPTILFFYGGNWRSGRRQDYRFVADTLMTLGCDVVVPDYRLYPQVRFSDIIQDARAAATTVLARLAPDRRLILMGHSAGAQIGALLTLDVSLLPDHAQIAGFIGLSGPYDFYPFTEDDHWELFGPEAAYQASQPVNFVRADAPPLFLLHGADDTRVRRGHSKSLMLEQQAAGGRAERRVYPGMRHVDLVVAFSRLHRRGNPVVRDVAAIIESLGSQDQQLPEPRSGRVR